MDTVFVDVGGTLLPNELPSTAAILETRALALSAALGTEHDIASSMIETIDDALVAGPPGAADGVIAAVLAAHDFDNGASAVRKARDALCVPLSGNLSPFDYAGELLFAIKRQGLACVIVSNTTFRDAEMYRLDFDTFGWGGSIDGCITSVDAGCCKPDPRIFRLALEMAGTVPQRCVMIGNSEEADIVPALRLGMRAIRVAIEEPAPAVTQAGACVTSLDQVPDVLRAWQRA